MTPEQITLIRETWGQVSPIRDQAAGLFYGRLFELDPGLRKLFTGDLTDQGQKLMAMIGYVVRKLDTLEDAVPNVQRLGVRHAGFGVRDEDYDTVARALLWTLEQGLGEAYTPAVAQAWTAAYTVLATTMKAAAADATAVDGRTPEPAAHA